MKAFNKVLVANRGEIAVRVIHAIKALGAQSVAVYSDADVSARHTLLADECVNIGPPDVAQSYLCAERIIAAAMQSGADAIHPGYGFLSENAAFAQSVIDAGIKWIGPAPASIMKHGRKSWPRGLRNNQACHCSRDISHQRNQQRKS